MRVGGRSGAPGGVRAVHAGGALALGLLVAAVAGAQATATETQGNRTAATSEGAARAELRTVTVRPGIAVITTPSGNVTVWSGPDGVVLVDSGGAGQSADLLAAVARVSAAPLRFVVNTHGHADHMGSNEAFTRKGAVVIGHESLRELRPRAAHDSPGAESPNASVAARPLLTINDALALHMNGDRLDVLHVADAHTSSDLIVRWGAADVICLGDLFWSGQYPYIDLEDGGSLAGIVAAVEASLARASARTVIVPGHGPVATRAELAAYRDMLVAVGRKVREAVEAGQGIDDILAARPTADFDARYAPPGATVSAEDFVRTVHRDLADSRASR